MLSNLLPTAQISDLDISADTRKIDRCWKKASRPPIESTRYKEERKKSLSMFTHSLKLSSFDSEQTHFVFTKLRSQI